MAQKTLTELESRLRTGDSRSNDIATALLLDLLDSIVPVYTKAQVLTVTPTRTQIAFLSDGTTPLAVWQGTKWIYAVSGLDVT